MHKWLVFLGLMSIVGLCLGAERQGKQERGLSLLPAQNCEGSTPALDVTSEHMTFDSPTHTFIFEGNVQVRRCQMTMHCDRLQVIQGVTGAHIERIIATGNVHVQQGAHQVKAERAEYFDAAQKLVLTGNPRAWNAQEQNELTGEEIVVLLQEDRLLVKRPRVLFHPRQRLSKTP